METESGKLYLVATPLGNLEDITKRALDTLARVDLVAAEDTRRTLRLLNHFGIKKRLLSFFQHNEMARTTEVIERLEAGESIALVSDAGMPGISDPGNLLVREAVARGITVVPIPGASAVITALAASGLNTGAFRFEGFLPRKNNEQLQQLRGMADYRGTLVFYEAPHRLLNTLKNLYLVLGDRPAVLARELTKVHEEFIRGPLSRLETELEGNPERLRGEFTIVVSGSDVSAESGRDDEPELEAMIASLAAGKFRSLREGIKEVARESGRSAKEIYQLYLKLQGNRE